MRSFLQILRLSQRQSGAHWSQQGFQNLKKSRLSFFASSSHAAIATLVNNNSSSREYHQEKKVVSRKAFSIFSLILTQEDEEEKRHFVYFGIAGVVLAEVVASKTSFKAEAPLDEEAVSEFIQEEPKKQDEPTKDLKENPRKSCVICVGSTGTGKSTLIKIMTGADIEISSRPDSVTKTSSVYTKKRGLRGRKPLQYWIDTQGWEDSDIEKQDNQIFKDIFQVTFQDNKIFKDIFQCLWDSGMTEISGIVWNINPNERATDTLQRQARLINMLRS